MNLINNLCAVIYNIIIIKIYVKHFLHSIFLIIFYKKNIFYLIKIYIIIYLFT